MNSIAYYVLSAFAVIITLTVHEYCHGYAAYKLGDPTARNMGRLTLNPLRHIDPFGALCMLFFHFGWAKPVPVSLRHLKNPRRDFAIISFAGPLSNFIMSFLSAFVYLSLYAIFRNVEFTNEMTLSIVENTILFFKLFHLINLGIAIFNLIPVPPLDGSRILGLILPPRIYYNIMRHERVIYYVMLGWLFLGDGVSHFLLSLPIVAANPILSAIASFLSLSNMLGGAIGAISDAIIWVLKLIPFLNF